MSELFMHNLAVMFYLGVIFCMQMKTNGKLNKIIKKQDEENED